MSVSSALGRRAPSPDGLEEPIVSELFSVERLEQHGSTLAAAQEVRAGGRRGPDIRARVRQDGTVLLAAYRTLGRAIREERAITPAAEWLVDNYHIVDEQLREIHDDLPSAYYHQLPTLAAGHLAGYPRVIGIAWAYVAHTDSRFDAESLRRFLEAYQRVEPLTIGELWAVATSLRVVLVENLRRSAVRIVQSREARQSANDLADRILGLRPDRGPAAGASPSLLAATVRSSAGEVQLLQRLRDQDPEVTPALGWLEEVLAARGTTADEVIRSEHQRQAAMNVAVRNLVTSMRQISWFDWAELVEGVSVVGQVLGEGSAFGSMDFATRDRYRHEIEILARRSGRSELEVARTVLGLAARAAAAGGSGAEQPVDATGSAGARDAPPVPASAPGGTADAGASGAAVEPAVTACPARPPGRDADPGYYLLSAGRPALEREIAYRVPWGDHLRRRLKRRATAGYLAGLTLATASILALPAWLSLATGASLPVTLLASLAALIVASSAAVAIVDRLVTHLVGPRSLPRLELPDGVPAGLRTLVAIPTLLTHETEIEALVNRLEVHFLANPEGDLRFALLTDWTDAPSERMPDDERLLACAVAGIERLNERHGDAPGGGARFLLLHRVRRWNAAQGVWMGWERKRGKLHELNALLRGAVGTSIVLADRASARPPSGVRYVITLDSDTRLPRGAAARLVGTMAHPLNRPRFDATSGRVVEGYGILQPRVTTTLPVERDASLFQRITTSAAGLDPYASAVSDVYQDLFDEGTYTGKGIYDLDIFEEALAGRAPENMLLSHDLLEGTFARAGLVTDIEVFDEPPSRYEEASARQHRWARGDWQLMPWILGRARNGSSHHGRMPAIARWKMLDNLRRTLVAPSALATLLVAWIAPAGSPGTWTGFVVLALAVPMLVPVVPGLVPRRRGISKRSHLRAVARDLVLASAHLALGVILLAHQAVMMLDAALRSLARTYITHRDLLEWTTAAQARAHRERDLPGFHRWMAGALAVAVVTAVLVGAGGSPAAPIAAPFIVLWLLSPTFARWISLRPDGVQARELSPADAQVLRLEGRRTWRFFETFVGPPENDLPPDNVQDDAEPVVAHRTSPTNIGLYLLSVVAARDLGWIGTLEMSERLGATLATVGRLERLHGHLYNWYDTRDLSPLEPAYVSTVDSGNLCGHLVTVAGACREMLQLPLPAEAALRGISDAVLLTSEALAAIRDGRGSENVTRRDLGSAIAPIRASLATVPATPAAWSILLATLATQTQTLVDAARAFTADRPDRAAGELVTWAEAAEHAVRSHRRDIGGSGPETPQDPRESAARARGSPPERFPTLLETAVASGSEPAVPEPAGRIVRSLQSIADDAQRLFGETDLGFLFVPSRKLFSIGFRVRDGTLDPNCYDLLASEARMASFLAIAKGDVEAKHWFRLGRPLTPLGRGSVLVSWSGSMFEYLMPLLVMQAPWESLLGHTYRLVVARQIAYAREKGVPWGISESGFNARDLEGTYQYSSFGIPGLGLKRGLSEDLVVAPYATLLSAMVEPEAAIANLARLVAAGARGAYGFREALDYTRRRLPEHASVAVVNSYMAHHQGMSLVAIANVVGGSAMVRRFHAEPIVQATDLLLQERMPRDFMVTRMRSDEQAVGPDVRGLVPPVLRRFTSPDDPTPRTHVLSNGRYAVMVTAAGSGHSRHREIAVSRWREDTTRDDWGTFLYLRDTDDGRVWSAGYQPTGVRADSYEVTFAEDRAELSRRDGSLVTELAVIVSAEDDAEVRRVSLTNLGSRPREVELTSYAEIVLAPQDADVAHPAFQNLFVQTELIPELGALVATRRPRAADEPRVWAAHVSAAEHHTLAGIQVETDRARFVGRGRSTRSPAAMADGRPLSNTVGSVLDPIFSIRRRVRVAPGETAHVIFTTLVGPSREAVVELADKYRDPAIFDRVATLAWTHAQVQLHHLGIENDEAHLYQRLANRLIYADPTLRPASGIIARNRLGPPGLWSRGISGDLPIVVVHIHGPDDLVLVRDVLRAHEYWRLKLLTVDLVIVNEQGVLYTPGLSEALETIVRTRRSAPAQEGQPVRGGVHLLRGDTLTDDERSLLLAAARVVLVGRRGSLTEQVLPVVTLPRGLPAPPPRPGLTPARADAHPVLTRSAVLGRLGTLAEQLPRPPLLGRVRPVRSAADEGGSRAHEPAMEHFNGLGGFVDEGRAYTIVLGPGQATPAPWINVIANPSFGFQVSETGSGYTWAENSRENQLTAWSNDPVADPPGEAVYVTDEETGRTWCPTAQPIRCADSTYVITHRPGSTRFEHVHDGIALEMVQLVALDDPVKISVLRVENRSGRARRLSVTAYAEWTLGTSRGAAAPHIITTHEPTTGALLAHNPWNIEHGRRTAFLDLGGLQTEWTADRREFLGRNGAIDAPAGLDPRHRLAGSAGAGLDPCAALRAHLHLSPGGHADVRVLLGQAQNPSSAVDLILRHRAADPAETLRGVTERWEAILGAVQVTTPDRSMDILLNGWLLYQTLACRMWARAAFYQAGGAYGFRDQLQDSLALLTVAPAIAREHILRAAARQFPEGDVQHWWHPPSGRGVRTRISDDRLWLPYVVDRYLEVTGDHGILEEVVPFIAGAELGADQSDAYFEPGRAAESATLFDHCARAIDRSLASGSHGLPLMGTGDWNDGMDRVGAGGRGESVWLGWFLADVLAAFAPLADARGDRDGAAVWAEHAETIRTALERDGWDGDWYRRAYFDDGSTLGSASDAECRIDSISQSWSVLSRAADPARAERAMMAVEEYLVRRVDQLVLLFTPPFDRAPVDPGYVKGYPPGIRENGGQYTHAATWVVIAIAMLGHGERAAELFAMLNPITRSDTRAEVHRYKVEPYVMAADIYAEPSHRGRGGWTWYTGSAGWMYQAGLEAILGFRRRGARLLIDPCIPAAWRDYRITYRFGSARYDIAVENPDGVNRGVVSVAVDGHPLADREAGVALADDGEMHTVLVTLG